MTKETDWAGLVEEAGVAAGGPRCAIARMVQGLPDPAARKAVTAALNGPASGAGLRRALQARDVAVPHLWAFGNHRRGQCSCKEETK